MEKAIKDLTRELHDIRVELQAIRKELALYKKKCCFISTADVIDEINRETKEKGASPLLL